MRAAIALPLQHGKLITFYVLRDAADDAIGSNQKPTNIYPLWAESES